MRRDRMFLDDHSTSQLSYMLYLQGETNRPQRERMRRILMSAVRHELTARQRTCITMYYLEGMKMKDIAAALSLSKSTVSRHIAAASRRLRHIASYYER